MNNKIKFLIFGFCYFSYEPNVLLLLCFITGVNQINYPFIYTNGITGIDIKAEVFKIFYY